MTRIANGWAWLVGLAVALATVSPLPASAANPPTLVMGKGEPVRIEVADTILRTRMKRAPKAAAQFRAHPALAATSTGCAWSLSQPAEVIALAAALKCDPDLIFEYVYNNIEYEPLFGSNKGPLGTLLDQRGSDLDQAQLLVALLSAAGFSSGQLNYQYGYIRLNGPQASGWLGVKNDGQAIANVFASGGIPIASFVLNGDGTLNRIDLAHVWVRAQIGGTFYTFDPSYKQHVTTAGMANIGTILGYTQGRFLADADGTTDSVSIANINRQAVRGDLSIYANNLITYIKGTNPAATVNDIVGGTIITPLIGSPLRQATVPNLSPSQPTGFPQNWGATVPNAYRTCFTISMPGVTPTTCAAPSAQTIALYADQTYGHRITISSVPSGSNFVPTLLIDGAAPPNGQNTGTAAPSGSWTVNVAITHPYTGALATGANQQDNLTISVGGSYLVSAGWGEVGRGMVEKHRTLLAQARAAGNSGSSEPVMGESLAVISYNWLAEGASSIRLGDAISAVTTQYHHGVGITAQTAIQGASGTQGPYVDLPLNYVTLQPQTHYTGSGLAPNVLGMFISLSGLTSSLESAVLEQTQALIPGMQAASTIRIVDTNAATTAKTFFADATSSGGMSAYFTSIRPNLVSTYSTTDLANIDGAVSTNGLSTGSPTGNQLLLPSNGTVAIGLWKGAGYTISYQNCSGSTCSASITQRISGGLSGGFSGSNVDTTAPPASPPTFPTLSFNTVSQVQPSSGDPSLPAGALTLSYTPGNVLTFEPVDTVTGAYLYQHSDLVTGSGKTPYALSFDRHYSSASLLTDLGLGNGWTNGFSIAASRNSDPFVGLGDRTPTGTSLDMTSPYAASGESSAISAASAIAATYVAQDLLKGTLNAQAMTIAWMTQRWQTDQLTNNAVLVTWPTSSEEFIVLPHSDGSTSVTYNPPSGSAVILTGTVPDPYGNFTTFSYLNKDRSLILFNAVDSSGIGKIASWSMPYGMSLDFTYGYTYNGSTYLSAVTNGLGRSLMLGYSGAHLDRVTDDNGRSVGYGYDAAGNLVSYTDPLGNQTRFSYDTSGTYDTAGHLTQIVYPSTPSIPFVTNWYDPLGRVNKQADANGNASPFYVAGSRTELVDAASDRHVTYQTARGKMLKDAWVLSGTGNVFNDTVQSNGVVNVASNQYDGQDRLAKAIAPEGGSTAYSYSPDLNQNVVQIVQTPKPGSPLSPLTTTLAYDALYNKPTMVTDPRGLVTQNAYDRETGNLLSTIADMGTGAHFNAVTSFTYSNIGQPLAATDALGAVTLNAYDSLGNLTSTTRDYGRLNQVTSLGYDNVGNATSVTDPNGNLTGSTYDAARRLTSVTAPAAPQTLVTAYSYDADGHVLQVSQAAEGTLLRTTSATYTPTGKVATATDANGNVTRTAYDAVDRVASVTDPTGSITTFAYDAMSRQTQIFNPAIQAGALVTRGYTPDGLTASLSDAAAHATTYAYDGLDRLATTTYPGGTTEAYTYDADANPLTKKTRQGDTITFTYDTLNRLATKAPPSSPLVTYSYDLVGHPTGISDTSSAIAAVAATASYAATYSYDALNRPIMANWTPAVAQTAPTQSGVTFAHGYDADDRRVSQSASDKDWLLYPAGASSTSYTANSLNQYSAVGAASPTYDGNGNLINDGTLSYGYDPESRLVSVAQGSTTLGAYTFDAQGRRKSKTAGGTTTIYVTDADNREVLEYDGASGVVERWYAYGQGSNEVLNQMDVAAGTRTTLIPDIQGSIIARLASNGATVARANFLPYGENPSVTTGTFRYTASRIDPETGGTASQPSGLTYMRARMYSPTWGRFLQPDPIGYQGGSNLYAYVGNDPLNGTDRSGNKIDIIAHEVVIGVQTGYYHMTIVVNPDNQAAYTNNPNFQLNNAGALIETIGAGPAASLSHFPAVLDSATNRPTDRNELGYVVATVSPGPGDTEDALIARMNTAANNYKSNEVNYNFLPSDKIGGYNSNGFVTGLINSLGANVPLPDQSILPMPGANRPVPAANFSRK